MSRYTKFALVLAAVVLVMLTTGLLINRSLKRTVEGVQAVEDGYLQGTYSAKVTDRESLPVKVGTSTELEFVVKGERKRCTVTLKSRSPVRATLSC